MVKQRSAGGQGAPRGGDEVGGLDKHGHVVGRLLAVKRGLKRSKPFGQDSKTCARVVKGGRGQPWTVEEVRESLESQSRRPAPGGRKGRLKGQNEAYKDVGQSRGGGDNHGRVAVVEWLLLFHKGSKGQKVVKRQMSDQSGAGTTTGASRTLAGSWRQKRFKK